MHDKLAIQVELNKRFSGRNPELSAFYKNLPKNVKIVILESGTIIEEIADVQAQLFRRVNFSNKVKYLGWTKKSGMIFDQMGTMYTPSGFEYEGQWVNNFLSLDSEIQKEQRSQIEREIERMFSYYLTEEVVETKIVNSGDMFKDMTKAQIKALIQNQEENEMSIEESGDLSLNKSNPKKHDSNQKMSNQNVKEKLTVNQAFLKKYGASYTINL